MSDTLQDKLRLLLAELQDDAYLQGYKNGKKSLEYDMSFDHKADQSIVQIIQAFKDANYVHIEPKDVRTNIWLSGEDWFSRFKAELDKEMILNGGSVDMMQNTLIMEAARRAAGVSDE
jgi:hypothetical protein